jgi:hypothetical protein
MKTVAAALAVALVTAGSSTAAFVVTSKNIKKVFRGQAFREQGFHDAAHEALKEALRSRSRAAEIRHLALAERAQNYLA